MRAAFIISLLATIVFAGSYFYREAQAICRMPLEYRIGVLDERFNLTMDEARLAIADAEAAWEDATERNLFTYSETADFSINFIFDERQALADAEGSFKERLDATENLTDAIRATYEELIARYETLQAEYTQSVATYERDLARYNETVARYNAEGGAPPEVFAELEAEKRTLDQKQTAINQQAHKLNQLVEEINQVGDRSNQLINTFNRGVETFNNTFGESREFTQGDYQGDRINIYTFTDEDELKLVLVHELGHALSLDHVESERGVMHYLLGGQEGYEVTASDLEEFQAICGASTLERVKLLWTDAYHQL